MPKPKQDAGRRLLPQAVDELADNEPERVLYEIPVDKELALPYRQVTARQYGNAVDRIAWWLRDTLGEVTSIAAPTVGYVGPGDLRYLILVVAAIKVGYKMLYISPRNTVEGDIAVIEAADCHLWLLPSSGSNIQRLFDRIKLDTFDLPDLSFFLDGPPVARYEYKKSWEQGRKDPCWVLHTSGSTGNPKPVIRYQDSVASIEANILLPPVDGRPLLLHEYFDSRVYLTFPFFHAAGLANATVWALFWGATVVFGPDRPVTLDVMKEVIRKTRVDAVFTAPSLVQEISQDGEFLVLLESVKAIAYGGGPVAKEAGDRIIKHTTLRLSIGTTESGWFSCVETDLEDWNYVHLHPNTGMEFQDCGAGLYELVAIRKPELERWQPIFSTFPDVQEYSFKDLFSRHPLKPNLYTYEGRADNVIVLSNGEKFQPHTMELLISTHPSVRSVVVAGQGRFQISLLIEPSETAWEDNEAERDRFLDELWPVIAEANKQAPGHAKLQRDHIIIAHLNKPFARTSKGTIRRGPTLELYKDEFDKIYEDVDLSLPDGDILTKDQLDHETVTALVRRTFQEVTNATNLADTDDFFTAAAVDSLQVVTLRRYLQKRLPTANTKGSPLNSRTIYENSTVERLSEAIYRSFSAPLINGDVPSTTDGVSQMVSKYTGILNQGSHGRVDINRKSETSLVILTGSTGSLGSYILNDLMSREDVGEIWCLNRSATAEERQRASNSRRGLRTDFEDRRVRFRQCNLASPSLDLNPLEYGFLLTNASYVIHTQWRVDFNLSLPSFEPQVQGVRNLIEFALQASGAGNQVRLFFTSSVGVANASPPGTPISEQKLQDASGAKTGYGKSKFVAEELLWQASQHGGVDVTICRVGQIAGPVKPENLKGEWNRKEWLPSIIQLSKTISTLPRTLGVNEEIDWIPVDMLSTIILELAFDPSRNEGKGRVFHCVNPSKTGWERGLLPTVRSSLEQSGPSGNVRIVPLTDWLEAVKAASIMADNNIKGAAKAQAFALIDFFSGLARPDSNGKRAQFDTSVTTSRSHSLKSLPPVSADWMKIWLQQWDN